MKKGLSMLAAALTAASIASGADASHRVPQARLPLMKTAPTIDGVINPGEWDGAIRMERFCGVRDPMLTGGEASFWVGSDGERLYIAVESETPPEGQLLDRVEPAAQDGDARVWLDDSIELVIDPLMGADESRRRLYHAILNARGAVYDQKHSTKGGGEAWRGNWETKSTIISDRWHFEVALPLADMDVKPEDLSQPFGVRVCRNWMRAAGPKQSEWSSVGGAFLSTETMPALLWDAAAPVVQTLQLRDDDGDGVHLKVAIHNPHAEPLQLRARLLFQPKSSANANFDEVIEVAAGEKRIVELAAGMAVGDEAYTLIEVTSVDGTATYYQRDFRWKLDREEPFFILDEHDAKRVNLQFAYFPYHHQVKVRIDLSGLKEKESVTGVRLVLQKKGGASLAEIAMPTLEDFKSELEWAIPELAEGEYQLVAHLQGVETEPVAVDFVRHTFEWEHNQIGMSDILIPPYTPIEVDGNQVSTVLRRHDVGATGLWEQVSSLDKPLLKGPMRLEVQANGQSIPAIGDGLTFSEKKPTRALAQGSWQAGPLKGTVQTDWDFDGAMIWSLTIDPTDEPVEALTLTIPLDNAQSPLMHACTDGIRFNYAGAVPAGEGSVWKSATAARNSIIGSYVPYLWVGAEERGLCVFGENDRGWITSTDLSCQELIRRGDTLELVLRLIAQPATIDAPRTIVIAFQATPVKPMPEDWRLWTFGSWRAAQVKKEGRHLAFFGSCYYWGTETPCLDWYPRDGDMTYMHKLAETRRTGEVDKAFVEEWLTGFEHIYATAKTPEARKNLETLYRNHTNAGFHTMKGQPDVLTIYTNGRGVRFDTPEGKTFLDEWYRDAYAKRDWGPRGGVAYDLDPVASFRDYASWYIKVMSDIVVDSIYWDDLFLQSNFDTIGTPAYDHPSGQVQPSVGLFNMREFVRRTARLYLEDDRPTQNIVHMTNTAITPVLSFAQLNYTWEDKAGAADFQDRYDRDYIRAESIGLQQGNVPIALWLVRGTRDAEHEAWVERTGTGVMLVHEIKTSGAGTIFWGTYQKMVDYGYGQPGVAVSQYWRADHPAKVEGSDAVSLVVSKPDSAMILVCDYGDGGELGLTLARESLGLQGPIKATDMENGEPLTVTAGGAIQFPLKKHDFKLILVERDQP